MTASDAHPPSDNVFDVGLSCGVHAAIEHYTHTEQEGARE